MPVPDRQTRIVEIFAEARELPEPLRDALIHDRAAGDESICLEVRSLLRNDCDAFLPLESFDELHRVVRRALLDAAPDTVPGYELETLLNASETSAVYRAHPRGKPGQTVAIKILETERTPDAARRFDDEARVLASMDLPNIARLLATGRNSDDQPYFVMEYINGERINDHAANHSLDLIARIALIRQVCEALKHSHQRGVIHRDIKPGNVLVVMADGHALVKVIDYGIAKIVDPKLRLYRQTTRPAVLMGTFAYMSPEQLKDSSAVSDVRIDVFAVGVLLYELMTGKLPRDVDACPITEAIRQMTDVEPPLAGTINPRCRGDLEQIMAKALRVDRNQRYQSITELSDDLDRFIRGEPVLARPVGAIRTFGKLVRRHRLAASGIALFALTLTATLIFALVAWRQSQERYLAAKHQVEFLLETVVDNLANTPGAASVRKQALLEVLKYTDQFLAQHEDDLHLQAIRAQALTKLGDIEREEGRYESALDFQRQSFAICERNDALTNSSDLVFQERLSTAHVKLGDLAKETGDLVGALEHYTQANAIDEAHADEPRFAKRLTWSYERLSEANHLMGRHGEAAQWSDRRIHLSVDLLQQNANDPARIYDVYMAYAYVAAFGELGDEKAYLETAGTMLDYAEQLHQIEPANRLYLMHLVNARHNIARLRLEAEDYDGATMIAMRTLAEAEPLLGGPNIDFLDGAVSLAACHDLCAYVALLRRDLPAADHQLGESRRLYEFVAARRPQDPRALLALAHAYSKYAQLLFQQGDSGQADQLARQTIDIIAPLIERSQERGLLLRAASILAEIEPPQSSQFDLAFRALQSLAGPGATPDPGVLLAVARVQFAAGLTDDANATVHELMAIPPAPFSILDREIHRLVEKYDAAPSRPR
jgi:tetratricopeptide (TPR) repeat protein/predicted Ser/Thr protein kinase